MVRGPVFGILAGYADRNDHDPLRTDPVFVLVADRSPDRLVADGRLPVLRARRAMRFPRAGLDAYIASVLVPAVPFPTAATTAPECPR